MVCPIPYGDHKKHDKVKRTLDYVNVCNVTNRRSTIRCNDLLGP